MSELDRRLAEAKAEAEAKNKKKIQQAANRAKSQSVLQNRATEAAIIAEQNKARFPLATEADKAAKKAEEEKKKAEDAKKREENILRINQQAVATKYSDRARALENAISTYAKSGNEKDADKARSIQKDIDKIAEKYKKYFGTYPPKATKFEETQIKNRREDIGPSGDYAKINITATGTAMPMDAETARENRRNLQPLNATVTPGNTPIVTASDPRVQILMKTGMTKDEAIAAVQNSIDALNLGGGGGTPSEQSAFKLFTEQETAGFANSIAQQLLGRELTADEIARATQTINVQSKASPTTTKTTGTTTVQTGEIDERQIVKEELQLAPEFANYQQATTYFDAMLGALRGPAGGGI